MRRDCTIKIEGLCFPPNHNLSVTFYAVKPTIILQYQKFDITMPCYLQAYVIF